MRFHEWALQWLPIWWLSGGKVRGDRMVAVCGEWAMAIGRRVAHRGVFENLLFLLKYITRI